MSRTGAACAIAGVVAGLAVIGACGGRSGGDPASRLFAVHNVMRALGRPTLGAVSQGSLAEGQEVRLPLKLAAACTTIVAFGGGGARDVSLTLVGPDGAVVAQENAFDAQAVLSTCVDRAGDYVIVVKMASGSGEYVASTFAGGEEPRDGGAAGPLQASGGTCEAPTVLVPGRAYNGTTAGAADEHQGSCGHSSGSESVYRLDVASRQRTTIEVSAQFDSVVYVRKGDCADEEAEVACNDDAPGGVNRSKIAAVLDTGTYYVFVDGYGDSGGTFRMQVATRSAPSMQDICLAARPIASAATVVGQLADAFDNAHATCGRGAKGPDVPHRFDLAARSRVRFTERSTSFHPVVHVRRTCDDEKTEVGCSPSGSSDEVSSWTGVLDPGTYWVYADSNDDSASGAFSLSAETAPATGASAAGAVRGDGCGDAISLGAPSGVLEGDTFQARDDVTVSCGRSGAADVAYRFDLRRRSRIKADVRADDGAHVIGVFRSCADRATELACARSIDRVFEPGTYFLVVDAKEPASMGRFSLSYRITDLALLESACSRAVPIALGRSMSATTAGAGSGFTPSCASRGTAGASPDRVYRFTVAKQMRIRATLDAKGFRPALSLRKACAEDASETQCSAASEDSTHAQVRTMLAPGTYFVVVDGVGATPGGAFTLRVEEDK